MFSWMKEEMLFTTWLVTSLLVLNKSILNHLYIWIFYTAFIQRFHLFDMLLKTNIQFIELELHRFLDIFRNIQKWCIHPQSLIMKYTMDTVTFHIKLTMKLRLKGYVALKWGCLYRGRRVFVFKKERMVVLPF